MNKNSELEINIDELKEKYSKLEDTIRNEHIPLNEYILLETEVKELRENEMNCKNEQNKENINSSIQSEHVKQLNDNLKILRNEMKVKEREHFDAVTKLHTEKSCNT